MLYMLSVANHNSVSPKNCNSQYVPTAICYSTIAITLTMACVNFGHDTTCGVIEMFIIVVRLFMTVHRDQIDYGHKAIFGRGDVYMLSFRAEQAPLGGDRVNFSPYETTFEIGSRGYAFNDVVTISRSCSIQFE